MLNNVVLISILKLVSYYLISLNNLKIYYVK